MAVEVWRALASDDAPALNAIYYPPSLALQYPAGVPADLTSDLRSRLGVSRDDCGTMGTSATARILRDGSGGDAVVFLGMRTLGFPIHYEQPTQRPAFFLTIYRRTPTEPWRFWGTVDNEKLNDNVTFVELDVLPK